MTDDSAGALAPDLPPQLQGLAASYAAAVTAQLAPFADYLAGLAAADVLLVKGRPGPAELAGQPPFSGSDGEALSAALAALGWGGQNWCGVLTSPNGLPPLAADALRLVIEANDPQLVISLDTEAQAAVKAAMGQGAEALSRRQLHIDGFEASLDDDQAKQRAWAELKQAAKA